MVVSTVTLTPDTPAVSGAGAITEPPVLPLTPADKHVGLASALDRGSRPDYAAWLRHVSSAAACSAPVRLAGEIQTVDAATGEVTSSRHTRDMPDAAIYKACGNRRASVCPACAEVYRADAYHLVLAGLAGGKGVPDTVTGHPAVFATLTAPGFGPVHTRRTGKDGQALPCRPRRKPDPCPHGRDLRCRHTHGAEDKRLGTPLCVDCYDYDHHAVWNGHATELWRRTIEKAKSYLRQHARAHADQGRVRLSFGKVAEFQARGVVHFHALIRLDGLDPHDPDAVVAPPEWATVFVLAHLVRTAVEQTRFMTDPHPARPEGWLMAWGAQLDIRPLRVRGDRAAIDETAVAGYCAKYATKATEATGHTSKRITAETIDIYADASHAGRIIAACWRLGPAPAPVRAEHAQLARAYGDEIPTHLDPLRRWQLTYGKTRRWAHMLGFGGHFFSKSRCYSTTFTALRRARTTWRRTRGVVDTDAEAETTLVLNTLTFAGIGWHTTGDALLANTSAALARERRRAGREEIRDAS